jgi:DNA polymerase III alpha subunit
MAGMYAEMFGEGNFFIELQDHGLPEQHRINPDLVKIARELNLPLVATNDAHYRCKGDSEPHDVLLCIQTGSNVADTNRMKFQTEEFYLKSIEEMSRTFGDTAPEAIKNTMAITEKCNLELDFKTAHLPNYKVPEGKTREGYLRELVHEGLKEADVDVTDVGRHDREGRAEVGKVGEKGCLQRRASWEHAAVPIRCSGYNSLPPPTDLHERIRADLDPHAQAARGSNTHGMGACRATTPYSG